MHREYEQIIKPKEIHCNSYLIMKIALSIPMDVGQELNYVNSLYLVYYIVLLFISLVG